MRARAAWLAGLLGACTMQAPAPDAAAPRPPRETAAAAPDTSAPAPDVTVPAPAAAPLRLGLLPVFDPSIMREEYTPLARHLAARLGQPVELVVPGRYEALLELLVAGDVDLVQLAPLSYVQARRRLPGLLLLASDHFQGAPSYSAYLLARPGLDASSPAALWRLRYGFVDRGSTSGFLYPLAFLLEAGLDPTRGGTSARFLWQHDRILVELLAGRIDVGASYTGALQRARQRGLPVEKLSIVAKTGRVPFNAWCARPGLEPALQQRLQTLLLGMHRDVAGREILDAMRMLSGFRPGVDADYDGVRQVLARVEDRLDEIVVQIEADAPHSAPSDPAAR